MIRTDQELQSWRILSHAPDQSFEYDSNDEAKPESMTKQEILMTR